VGQPDSGPIWADVMLATLGRVALNCPLLWALSGRRHQHLPPAVSVFYAGDAQHSLVGADF
jgi:hypothetical protein